MQVKLGDLSGNLNVLRQMRDQLIDESEQVIKDVAENERWVSFDLASRKISEACEGRNLESLVSAVREMKNRLRRPAIRKALMRMEAEKDEAPQGDCKCDQCGGVIDGSSDPCIPGALCTKCALEKRNGKEEPKKDAEPKRDDAKADTGKSVKDREAEDEKRDSAKKPGLRRRGYEGER